MFQARRDHPEDRVILKSLMRVLSRTVQHCAAEVYQLGGVQVAVDALRAFPDCMEMQYDGAAVLSHLSASGAHDAIVEAGGHVLFVRALRVTGATMV